MILPDVSIECFSEVDAKNSSFAAMGSSVTLRKAFTLLLVSYILLLPFEWVIYKWLFTSISWIKAFRLFGDVFPSLLLCFGLVFRQIKLTSTGSFLLLLYFLLLFIIVGSNTIHGGQLTTVPSHFGVLVRFLPLALVITYLSPEQWNFDRLRHWAARFLASFMVLGVLEILFEERIRSILLPSKDFFLSLFGTEPVAWRVDQYYQVSTVFANPIDYCFLLIGLYIIYLSGHAPKVYKLMVGGGCILLVYHSRSFSGLLFLMGLIFFAFTEKKQLRLLAIAPALVTLGLLIYTRLDSIIYYLEISYKFSRLGILLKTFPEFMTSNPIHVFLGLGSDPHVVRKVVLNYERIPEMLIYDEDFTSFEDMYWVAFIIQNGLIVFLLLAFAFYHFRRLSVNLPSAESLVIRRLIAMVVLIGFVNQILEVKPFSLLLWVTLGVMLNYIRTKRAEQPAINT